jgi:hypothetical protein
MSDERPEEKSEERPPEEVKDGVLRIFPPQGGEHAAALAESSRAFARGDFGSSRRIARRVCAGNPSAEERSFAQEILKRTARDPVAIGVGVASFLIFWLVIALTIR